jgi:hypothetical protein
VNCRKEQKNREKKLKGKRKSYGREVMLAAGCLGMNIEFMGDERKIKEEE